MRVRMASRDGFGGAEQGRVGWSGAGWGAMVRSSAWWGRAEQCGVWWSGAVWGSGRADISGVERREQPKCFEHLTK